MPGESHYLTGVVRKNTPSALDSVASAAAGATTAATPRPNGEADVKFTVYKQFNDPAHQSLAGHKRRLHHYPSELFPSDDLPDRLARALAAARVMHIKELLESFEFFARVRRRLRRPTMVDLCAGHGLSGILFALCEKDVQRVVLMDQRVPDTFETILKTVVDMAPWVGPKVEFQKVSLDDKLQLPPGAGTLLVHACGSLTDVGLRVAIRAGGPVAAMPCCYGTAKPGSVRGLKRALGTEVAADVARTYLLDQAGYQVDWGAIPSAVTPKNRIIIGWNR